MERETRKKKIDRQKRKWEWDREGETGREINRL